MTQDLQIANRDTIALAFGTDDLTTHNILQNLGWGFIASHFANPEKAWEQAHPFYYGSGYRDYTSFSIDFIREHFTLFASQVFTTWSGWGDFDPVRRIVPWVYESFYRTREIKYN